MLQSLIYVSTSTLSPAVADREVDDIVAAAQRNNVMLDLTGALLFTGSHFAQVLEGSEEDIEVLLQVVTRDPRHCEVSIADRSVISQRRFADWRMAYSGPSRFVSGFVSRVLDTAPTDRKKQAATWLADLMLEFNRG